MLRQQESRNRRRHIPSEIVEEILVNLSVKPLLRFSSVSKSWNSIISDPEFISKHRRSGRSAIQERIVIDGDLSAASTRSIISIDTATTSPLICPFFCEDSDSGVRVNLLASCGDLWFVQYASSMFLWNPSASSYKKLPYDRPFDVNDMRKYLYGLGYDSLGDDYKIVKIHREQISEESEVYSLRSDSWRKIEPTHTHLNIGGAAVNGALHWVADLDPDNIISLNLSTENYAQVEIPPETPHIWEGITVLRGNLCMHWYSFSREEFVLWEMQEYGVAESWTKTFVIANGNFSNYYNLWSLRPLYIYDDGKLLITVSPDYCDINDERATSMFIYIDEHIKPEFVCHSIHQYGIGFLFWESLVSPATYCP